MRGSNFSYSFGLFDEQVIEMSAISKADSFSEGSSVELEAYASIFGKFRPSSDYY